MISKEDPGWKSLQYRSTDDETAPCCRVDGWGASAEQLQAYIQRGCSSHQLHIAKLHPFICSWERLGDTDPVETGMQKEYSFIVKQIHPGKEPSDIHEIDRENVRKTPILLREL